MPRAKVHDEALRRRLIECAGAALSTGGLGALSLRALAAQVGTSTTAVYALFGGKPGLLEELHASAFSRLGDRLSGAATGADPAEDLVALGLAYRDAALADPHWYEVMFGGALPAGEGRRALAAPAFAPVLRLAERAVTAGAMRPGTDPVETALTLWATLHGLVSLHLRGLGPVDDGVFDAAVRAVINGYTAPNWRSPASPRPGTM